MDTQNGSNHTPTYLGEYIGFRCVRISLTPAEQQENGTQENSQDSTENNYEEDKQIISTPMIPPAQSEGVGTSIQ